MIVVDTNVVVSFALPSDRTEAARNLFKEDPEWLVPLLWRSEFRNVLALRCRLSMMTLEEAVRAQSSMEQLLAGNENEVRSVDVLQLASQSGCTAYDCEFVALAKSLGVKLVTLDRELAGAFPETATLLAV